MAAVLLDISLLKNVRSRATERSDAYWMSLQNGCHQRVDETIAPVHMPHLCPCYQTDLMGPTRENDRVGAAICEWLFLASGNIRETADWLRAA
ncbi:hypothetical protein GDO78_021754 [Eleutherodactylus coqui]|uniref:Uncharacterized protein n=1 Tax=Eleutherodactylus coqui TaxID=57060 RepID=A0A8J6EGL4_ELECQ|nr:hypothetical protein GDO78_021754 [Eleutherodactylus coqui]